MVILASFWKPEDCGQTVLPDRSFLIEQKLMKNAKFRMRHFESFSNNVFYWPIENHYLKMSSTVIKDEKSFFLTTIATEIHFCSISCISHTSQGIAGPDQGVLIIVRILVTTATKAIIADFGVSPRFRKVRFPPCWCLNKKKVCWGFLKKKNKNSFVPQLYNQTSCQHGRERLDNQWP